MIVDVYDVSNIIVNKNRNGWLSPTRFSLLVKNAQLRVYDELFAELRRAKYRKSRYQSELTVGKIMQALSTIYKSYDLTNESGKFEIPSDCNMLESVYVEDNLINEVTMSELKKLKRNEITAPTEDNPLYVNMGGYIQIYPDSIGLVEDVAINEVSCAYYGTPEDPNISYVTTGDVDIIDPSSSTDLSLPYMFFDKIVVYVLEQVGITLREDQVEQYAQKEESKELQKDNA